MARSRAGRSRMAAEVPEGRCRHGAGGARGLCTERHSPRAGDKKPEILPQKRQDRFSWLF